VEEVRGPTAYFRFMQLHAS